MTALSPRATPKVLACRARRDCPVAKYRHRLLHGCTVFRKPMSLVWFASRECLAHARAAREAAFASQHRQAASACAFGKGGIDARNIFRAQLHVAGRSILRDVRALRGFWDGEQTPLPH